MLSQVQFFVTSWTIVCQAPLSMEFSTGRTLEAVICFSRDLSQTLCNCIPGEQQPPISGAPHAQRNFSSNRDYRNDPE